MTYEEALKVIKENLSVAIQDNDGLDPEYEQEQVDGLKLAKEALEKRIKEKPIPEYGCCDGSLVSYKCPVCNISLVKKSWKQSFCAHCGQKLDWSEENE